MLGTLTLVNPMSTDAIIAASKRAFFNGSIEQEGGMAGVAAAGAAVGGFVAGKFARGLLNSEKALGRFGFAVKPLGKGLSWGDLISAAGTVIAARFVGSFMPDIVRPGFEGGAAAAALHTVFAPFLPKTLQGQYEPKAVGASYPTKATVGANGDNNYAKDDHRNNSAYNVAVGDPVGASYIIHPDYY